jgi:hypothetical protein
MSVKYARVHLLLVVMAVAGCSSDQVVVDSSAQVDHAVAQRIQRDAEDVALFYSGEFRPPPELVREISSQMYAMHGVGADTGIDALGPWVWFQPPWLNHTIECLLDRKTTQSIIAGHNRQWDALVAKYDLTVRLLPSLDTFFFVTPIRPVHPELLAEKIEDEHIDGMLWLSTTPRPHPIFSNIARRVEAYSIKYFIRECPCPDLWSSYQYYEFHGFSMEYHGRFRECPEDTSAVWQLPWKSFQAVLDSIEASRPTWVDTARTELRKVEHW